MLFTLPEQIIASRLLLRPCIEDDYPAFAAFMGDEEATRHLAFAPQQKKPEGYQQLFEMVLGSYESETPMFVLAICLQENGQYIGSCGLNSIAQAEAECYYTLLPAYWGQGYATEATGAMLDYAFDALKLAKVVACVSNHNPASERVAQKLGMVWEADLAAKPEEYREAGKRFTIDAHRYKKQA